MTPRQRDTYDFIRTFIEERRYSPSRKEICTALGITSRDYVQRLISNLKDKGLLTYEPHRPRSIQLIDPADRLVRAAGRLLDSVVDQSSGHDLAIVSANALAELESAVTWARRRSPAAKVLANATTAESVN